MKLENITKQVIAIAKEAGDFALESQGKAKIAKEKEKGDYATNIDLETEALIVKRLQELDAQIPVYAEESNIKPDDDIYWVVDPIDGTKNYFRGLATWSVNIALYSKQSDEILIGVVYFPVWSDMFDAFKDGGARLNREVIEPSRKDLLKETFVYTELPVKGRSSDEAFDQFAKLLKSVYRVRGWGLASGLCYTANGAFDAHVDYSETTKPFDIFAPLIIAKEAGCAVKQEAGVMVVGNPKVIQKL